MRKLAVFVEGQTEQIFVERLVLELANRNEVKLRLMSRSDNPILTLEGDSDENGEKYFVLIYDCQTDGQVKPKIIESASRLSEEGFNAVLGLLDLYPMALSELAAFKTGLAVGLPVVGELTSIHIAVAEVEAWFLQESQHFQKVHAELTLERIMADTGFDPLTQSAESVGHPAELLRDIYRLVGMGYAKRRYQVERTVESLDFDNLCGGCFPLIPSFGDFCASIESFLTPTPS